MSWIEKFQSLGACECQYIEGGGASSRELANRYWLNWHDLIHLDSDFRDGFESRRFEELGNQANQERKSFVAVVTDVTKHFLGQLLQHQAISYDPAKLSLTTRHNLLYFLPWTSFLILRRP
jgi:hypothetical protein